MNISEVNLNQAEIIAIALLSVIVILLILLFLRLNKKFDEVIFKSDEQARHVKTLQDD